MQNDCLNNLCQTHVETSLGYHFYKRAIYLLLFSVQVTSVLFHAQLSKNLWLMLLAD